MTISFPSDTEDVINDIREAIGRNVTAYVTVSGIPCPDCELDPVTNTAVNSFCTTCDGKYWISTTSGVPLLAHVKWSRTDQPLYTSGGIVDEGDCIVTIAYNEDNLDYVENSQKWVVDGRDLYRKNHILKGVPGLNRIRVVLKEDAD